jgi:WD40 repeat protein
MPNKTYSYFKKHKRIHIVLLNTLTCLVHQVDACSMIDNRLIESQRHYKRSYISTTTSKETENCSPYTIKVLDAPDTIKKYYTNLQLILKSYFPAELCTLISEYHTSNSRNLSGNLYEHAIIDNTEMRRIGNIVCTNITMFTATRGSNGGWVTLWRINPHNSFMPSISHMMHCCDLGIIKSLALCGKYLVAGVYEHTIKIFDLATAACSKTLTEHDYSINALTKISSQGIIAAGDHDGIIRIWNIHTGNHLQIMHVSSSITTLKTTAHQDLVVGDWSGSISLFKRKNTPQKDTCLYDSTEHILYKHRGKVNAIARRGHCIVSGSDAHDIVLVNTTQPEKALVLVKETIGKVAALVIDYQNNIIAGGSKGTIVYNITTGKYMNVDNNDWKEPATAIALTRDGRCIMTDAYGRLSIWGRDLST